MPTVAQNPARRVKNGPTPMTPISGSMIATPPADKKQRVRFPAADAVDGESLWISTDSVFQDCGL